MMKEFDAQTMRVTERVNRQINEERQSLREKINVIFMPKITEVLREFRVSETMIRVKMSELEADLNQITFSLAAKKSGSNSDAYSNSSTSSIKSSSANCFSGQLESKLNKIDEANSKDVTTKRSVSSLVHSSRSTTQNPTISKLIASEVQTNSPLYSKSTSSMNEVNQSPSSTSMTKNDNAASASSTNTSMTLISGYKYTPLRQSWSNLSQMNALSPSVQHSPSVHNSTAGNNSNINYSESMR
jgi:hypothetical protein